MLRITPTQASCITIALVAAAAGSVSAADHREAPLIREDSTVDINDVFAFMNPNDSSRIVLAMTVNPFSAPPENPTYRFSTRARYIFNIDNDGDAIADRRVVARFSDHDDGTQRFRIVTSGGMGVSGMVTEGTFGTEAPEPIIAGSAKGIQAFAGQRDDPFFFDVVGFNRFLMGTGGFEGNDGFGGYNVHAIVVELPVAGLAEGSENLQIWGATERQRVTIRRESGNLISSNGPFVQVDRMGVPAVATALIPSGLKDLYNAGDPENDGDDFAGAIVASLMALGTNEENIGILASVAVPDTLKLNLKMDAGFPNGRAPSDDVVDTLLFFIFNQKPVSDMVDGNDKPFLDAFPYLADPHQPR